jgi:uncharacterized membrane protein (UPF0127 family)
MDFNTFFKFSFLFLFCFIFLFGCLNKAEKEKQTNQTIRILIESCSKEYEAWVAKTPEELTKGLSNIKDIKENQAMLFVFDDEKIRNFWMKDTYFDIDIIFLDKNKKVVNFFGMQKCTQKDCPIYSSKKNAMYAIEIKKTNLTNLENCLKIGDEIRFELKN